MAAPKLVDIPTMTPVVEKNLTITRQWLGVMMALLGVLKGTPIGAWVQWGTGDPETVVSANVGSIYLRTDGGPGATLYVKESNSGNTTGWAAK